jgi:methanogenic corrinoid protein MtbC1/uroporphyrinogen-III decarboxylase
MMTPAELFLETIKQSGKPDRQLRQYEGLHVLFENPLDGYLRQGLAPGCTVVDHWGVTMIFPENAPGPTPHITPETKVCPDITHWRDYVHAPDLRKHCSQGWESVRAEADKARQKGKLATSLMGTGIFEQCHFLMGFEDTLTNLYEHPQEMHELIDYILQYRMEYVRMVVEHCHPDVILSHDDWGTKDALFMKAEMWREFFKEPYRQFYDYIRSQGIVVIHHADSYLVPIVEDMVELGIQVWQGVLPENNIPALQQQLQGRMTLMGGVGAAIDRPDSTEEEIYDYVTKLLEDCAPYGHLIPCITYGAPGTVFPHVDPVINRAIEDYNKILHLPSYRPAQPVRRQAAAAAAVAAAHSQEGEESGSLLEMISAALQKGQRKRVLSLCQEATEAGMEAQTILSQGLVEGMTRLGEDFTAGRAFVPEMLLAARCMTAATEQLKPLLMSQSTTAAGRVCLGTVKGDMHDIGKNLVKIMMEGSGLEVIDLGVDVSAETFVQTAVEQKCDIIACSALLTTTMNEMRRVVSLAQDTGIRDQVKIMVGGAPISQAFCDEIGADIYTEDAASAAKAAVEAVK